MIGERLYDLRKDAGMTQDELADLLKISKHSISAYERDKNEPPDAIKIAIARHFNVTVDYLVGLSDDPSPLQSEQAFHLPPHFPQESLPELKSFAEYLTYKKISNSNTNRHP